MSISQINFKKVPNFGKLLQRHFFSGVLVLIPLFVIFWILGAAAGFLWQLQEWLPDAWNPEAFNLSVGMVALIKLALTIGIGLLLALGTSLLGWVSKQYIGQKSLELVADLIQRIPVVRSIYSALDQLLKTLAAGGEQQFHRVVYVEYPRRGLWTLAFVTGAARGPAIMPDHLNIYVPTTPNPTSGFYLIVPESDVRDSQLSVEEAFKTILSLGIAQSTAVPSGSPGKSHG